MPEYYDGVERRQFENPFLRWPLIVSGIIMLFVGVDIWELKGEPMRGIAYVLMGSGMGLYGVTLIFIRQSSWKWTALAIGLTSWFGGLFMLIRAIL